MSLTLVGVSGMELSTRNPGRPDKSVISGLSEALRRGGVRYCQWKGHAKRARWSSGQGDIDLLIDRRHHALFAAILGTLGFKPAWARDATRVPGVVSYLAPERAHGRFIHVHAHYRLVIGDAWARHYIIPIEDAVLDSATECDPFPIPAPEYEFAFTVINFTLRHAPGDAFGRDEASWLRRARSEFERLQGDVRRPAVHRAVARHLPELGQDGLLDRCGQALLPGHSTWFRLRTRISLERRLEAYRRRPPPWILLWRAARRVAGSRFTTGKHPVSGGLLVALVGADGAGKSTCARALREWLGQELRARRAHLGLPARSIATLVVGGALKFAQSLRARAPRAMTSLHAHVELLRLLCTARDRYRMYRRMRRAAADGDIVICERYPLHENRALVGPSTVQGQGLGARSRLASWMRRREAWYYVRITRPDLILALRVDPETASSRKTTEPEAYVRARARTMAAVQWSGPRVHTIDAGRPLDDVLAKLQTTLWEAL